MGLKRKASTLEDSYIHPKPISSPVASQLTTSPPFAESFDPLRPNHAERGRASHLNSRTRKRHRDGRPDEETIHENTLKRLYEAQRLHLDERIPIISSETDLVNDESVDPSMDQDVEMMMDEPEAELPQTIQRNQKTIDSFFGGKAASQPTTTSTPDFSLPTPAATPQKPDREAQSTLRPGHWEDRPELYVLENGLAYPDGFTDLRTPRWTEC